MTEAVRKTRPGPAASAPVEPPLEAPPAASRRQSRAFTLVELLVVISIIVLLVGILVPVVGSALQAAEKARTEARVAELGNACYVYHTDHGCFPGQRNMSRLGEHADWTKDEPIYTGSQWLAGNLFDEGLFDPADIDTDPAGKFAGFGAAQAYAVAASDDLVTVSGLKYSISDRTSDPMAVLYFPAKLGVKGEVQYDLRHNIEYIRGNGEPECFYSRVENWKLIPGFITDTSAPEERTPHNPQAFLLIAAGKDRKYLTSDDIKGPKKW